MTQKITMGRDKRQDKIDAINAMRQSQGNPYVSGLEGPVKSTRDEYGSVSRMPQEVLEGPGNNFAQEDAPANAPLDDPRNQTGDLALGSSATKTPSVDQDQLNTEKLQRRLAMYREAGSNAFDGNNNRAEVGTI